MNEQIDDILRKCSSYKKIVKKRSLYDLICKYVTKLHPFHLQDTHQEILKALLLIKGFATDERRRPSNLEKDFLNAYNCLIKFFERESPSNNSDFN